MALGAELLAGARLVLLRLPRSLDRLDEVAGLVAGHAASDVVVVAGGRIKHMSLAMNEVLGAWFDAGRRVARPAEVAGAHRAGSAAVAPSSASAGRGGERHDDLGVTIVGHGGVFAGTGVDIGTRFLLEQLGDAVPDAATAVDLACGSGVVAAWLAHARPALRVTATDRSAAAAASARETAEVNALADRIHVTQADGLELLADASEPLIVLNPPFHSDAALHTGIAAHLFEDAARVLAPGGELWCVWNSHLRYRPLLERAGRTDPAGGAECEVHRDRLDPIRVPSGRRSCQAGGVTATTLEQHDTDTRRSSWPRSRGARSCGTTP